MLIVFSIHASVSDIPLTKFPKRIITMSLFVGALVNVNWTAFLEALNYISIGQDDIICNT